MTEAVASGTDTVGTSLPNTDSPSSNHTPTPEAAEPKKVSAKHKVKIDGEELEVELEELLKGYQTGKSSTKKFEEAKRLQAEVADFLNRSKENPWELLQQLGVNIDELAERRVADKLEWELKPEQERKLIEMERELKKYKQFEEETKKSQQEQQKAQLAQSAMREVDDEIGAVLKQSGVKPTPRVVARIAETMLAALEAGQKLPAAKAFERTQKDLKDEVISILGSLPIEQAVSLLPKEFTENYRKHLISKVSENKPFSASKSDESAPRTGRKQKFKSTDDFFKNLEKRYS